MISNANRTMRSPLGLPGHPIYPMVLPVTLLCFVGTVVTDSAYLGSADMMWLDLSSWLLLTGLVFGGLAGAFLLIDLIRLRHSNAKLLRVHFALLLAAWIVAIFNSFIHARDGWTAVMPSGITLSVIGAALALLAGWVWQTCRSLVTGATR